MTALPMAFIIAFAASAVIGPMQLLARDRAGLWTVSAALVALVGVFATKGFVPCLTPVMNAGCRYQSAT